MTRFKKTPPSSTGNSEQTCQKIKRKDIFISDIEKMLSKKNNVEKGLIKANMQKTKRKNVHFIYSQEVLKEKW